MHLRCEQIYKFSENSRNELFFNPHGNLLALCGFGNLRGTVEIWDLNEKQQLKDFKATDTTYFEWISDGCHFLTATTSPRLRVDNCYGIWHYLQGKLYEKKYEKALYKVSTQPIPHTEFPEPQDHSNGTYTEKYVKEKPPKAYKPPHIKKSFGGATDKEKKMKKIKKSLQSIEKLKIKQDSGVPLEINQVQKIAKEKQLKAELEQLTLG